jgi:hypothetical protein
MAPKIFSNKRVVFLVCILVLSAALGGLVLLLKDPPKTEPVPVPEIEYILKLDDITSVSVKNAYGEFTVRSGEQPVLAGFEGYALSSWDLGRMLDVLSGLVSRGLVSEDADPDPFGLVPPRAEIRIESGAGETFLYLGNDAPDGSNVYVMKSGGRGIYLAESWNFGNFLKRDLDFIDTEVSPPGTDDGAGGFVFDSVHFGGRVRRGGEITVIKEYLPETETVPGLQRIPYRITTPLEAKFSMDKGLPLIQGVFGIRASRVAARASAAELKSFGLDAPWSTAQVFGTLENGLGGFGLRVSEPDTSGNVFLMREGSDLVFEAGAAGLPWLSADWFQFMDKLIVLPFIDSVAQVEVRSPQKTAVFSLSGEGDALTVNAEGVVIDTAVFRPYYQTLITASYQDVADISPSDPPFLEITYRYRDGKKPDRVSFYPAASRRVLVSFNGGRAFYAYSAYTDKVIGDLDLILQNRKVLPYL